MAAAPAPAPPAPAMTLPALERILQVQTIQLARANAQNAVCDVFVGESTTEGMFTTHVYGGQLVGQALVAASRTVPSDRVVHSLHCHFLEAGDHRVNFVFTVERLRDGKSFSVRSITARQNGAAIFTCTASFQKRDEYESTSALTHQDPMPLNVPSPDKLLTQRDVLLNAVVWLRMPENFSQTSSEQILQCVLAFASDWGLLETAALPHGLNLAMRRLKMASLDHSIHFLRALEPGEWLLYEMMSGAAAGGRGIASGRIFRQRDGALVATCLQEGLMRVQHEQRSTSKL